MYAPESSSNSGAKSSTDDAANTEKIWKTYTEVQFTEVMEDGCCFVCDGTFNDSKSHYQRHWENACNLVMEDGVCPRQMRYNNDLMADIEGQLRVPKSVQENTWNKWSCK